MKALRPLFLIVSLILMVGLACSVGSPAKPTEEPTTVTEPTAAPDEPTIAADEPTVAADEPTAAADEPTETPESTTGGDQYFTDTFDGTLDNYTVENRKEGSDEDKMNVHIEDGYLVFDLKGNDLYVYVTYNPVKYKDVKISMTADNRGKNNNNVSLICRQSDEGWYEFNIANNGLYWIYAYDSTGTVAKGYNRIYNGGSKAIKQGKGTNEYTASCVGDKLTLSINGTEVKTIRDTKFQFNEGTVGFGVSSFNVTPILVQVDSFTISEP